jgi:hypothetical protein
VVEPAPEPIPEGDLARFAADVQPILDHRCATPSCHGRPDRALSIYSSGRYRSDPARTFLSEPLTADELAANVRGVAAFTLDVDRLDDVLVVRKPLAIEQGGCWHAGGEIFGSVEDRDLRALRAWLAPLVEEGGAP